MSSNVFFKFKSQKDPQRVTFDGTGISVFELKREIITQSQLGDGTDFDLSIYNQDTNEEYTDDTVIIPRSTSVVARRLPASKPGQGRAARYVSGLMPTISKNAYRTEKSSAPAVSEKVSISLSNTASAMSAAQTEEEKIAAMFKAGDVQWEQQKQQMAGQTPIFRPNANKAKNVAVPDHPPPPGYVCHRCRQKGHWIQACPTNNDPKYDNNPRVKRTTGIPRSFLVTVDEPEEDSVNDGLTDDKKQPTSIMINSDGKRVIAVPDKESWEEFKAKADASAVKQDVAATGSKELQERGLECLIDRRLFVEPMKTPCCSQTYCNDCIENALVNSDLVCPNCSTEGVLFDNLVRDDDMVAKIQAYKEHKEQKKAEPNSKPKAKNVMADESEIVSNDTPMVIENVKEESPRSTPTPNSSTSTPVSSKKRPADTEPSNEALPTKMQKTDSQQSFAAPKPKSPQQPAKPLPPPSNSDQDFVAQMNMLAQQQGSGNGVNNMLPSFPMGMNGFNPMSMPGMMGMNAGMMNPMMMNMGMPGMGMSNMMGFPDMGGDMSNVNGMNNMNFGNQGVQQGWSQQQQGGGRWQGNNNFNPAKFNNGANFRGSGGGFGGGNFANQIVQSGGDDDAYMRKPVNPHRYPGRQRKTRPTDYREV